MRLRHAVILSEFPPVSQWADYVRIMSFLKLDRLKRSAPWFVKIPAKIMLSRLPVGGRQWQRLHLFRAGTMDNPAEAFEIFKKHLSGAGLTTLQGCTVVELGPGNSALTGLFAYSLGAKRSWLVDAEELASQDTSLFARAEQMLNELKLPVPGIGADTPMNEALRRLNCTYLTGGLASLQEIPDAAVDFLFSNAVLEHVRLADFSKLVREMHRILKPNGVASHQIDFRDHLQEGLNNLRFSERTWESQWMAGSGFYTNRLTWPVMNRIFQEAGFSVELKASQLWPDGLPTPQRKMAYPFKQMEPGELMIKGAHAILRPSGSRDLLE